MRKVKCAISAIVELKGGIIKLVPEGSGIPYPSTVELTDEEIALPQTQYALANGWVVFVDDPPPAPKPVEKEKCHHGFYIDEKCDYCAADKDVPAGVPAIVEQLEAQDALPVDPVVAAPTEVPVQEAPAQDVSRKGRKKKNDT